MPELENAVSEIGKLKRPSNARDRQAVREQYERTLAGVIITALQKSPPFDEGAVEPRRPKGVGKRSA